MPSGAKVLTLIPEVKMRLCPRDVGGASDAALSSKPRGEEWPPDTLILRTTFPVRFVGIFSVSQWCSRADTDFVKPAWKTAGRHKAVRAHTAVLCAGAAPLWIRSLWAVCCRGPVNPSRKTEARMTPVPVRSMEKSSRCSVWRTWSQSVVYVGKQLHTLGTGSTPLGRVPMTVR